MAIDKSIDYVEQDGSLNFIKNSESVTVPKEFKARKNAPATKLAYITADEAKMLKKMKKGTPHKGPKGIPSYDSFDAQGSFRSGEEMSAAERGDAGAFGNDPGARQEAQDIRSSVIAAGAGQRVNPGFFDSRDTVSPAELARAKAFNPTAFRQNRGGGIMNFITSGGLLGNLARSLGQRLGLGKRFNEPTYDMRQFSNPTFQDDLDNEGLLSLINDTNLNDIDLGNPLGDDRIVPEEQGLEGDGCYKISSSPLSLSDTELQNRINIANQFDLPIDYSDSDLKARTIRAMTQPGILATLGPNNIGTVTAYDPYKEMYSSSPNNLSSDVNPEFKNMIMQTGLSKKQKQILNRPDVRFSITDPTGSEQEAAIDSLLDQGSGFKSLGDPDDPATKQDIKKFYGIDV